MGPGDSGPGRGRRPPPPVLPDKAFAAALSSLPGMGWRRLGQVLDGRSATEAWHLVLSGRAGRVSAPKARWRELSGDDMAEAARRVDVASLWARCAEAGVEVLLAGEQGFPAAWRGDPEGPSVAFFRGDPAALSGPLAGLVGTRSATHYGEGVAAELGGALSAEGVAVVSGLALGIDAAAHEGALARGGAPPVGVVATGIDVPYPRANRGLWGRVAEHGLLASEHPPGTGPAAWRFPNRNRLIAALCGVIVVVESHRRGGALQTAEAAASRGVPVMAVPGSVRSPASTGTNSLLADGAAPVRDVSDVLAALSLRHASGGGRGSLVAGGPERLAPEERSILEAVGWEATTLESVLLRTGFPLGQVASALEAMSDRGLVRGAGGWWSRAAPPPA